VNQREQDARARFALTGCALKTFQIGPLGIEKGTLTSEVLTYTMAPLVIILLSLLQELWKLLMILTRCVLPLRGSAVRPYVGTSQFWSSPKHLTHTQPLAVRRDLPPSRPRHPVAGPRTPRGLVWMLALVGFVFGILALGRQDAVSPVASEVMGSLRVMALWFGASPALSSAEEWPLLPMARLASLPDEHCMLDDYDVDDDDSSAMPLLTLIPHVLPPVPVGVRLHGSTQVSLWPTPYHARPEGLAYK
jgi:hypothetical protein